MAKETDDLPQMMTCAEVAKKIRMSTEFVRSACYRGKEYHPLPHIRYGSKKKFIRLDLQEVKKWLEEEMTLNAGAR